MDQSFKSDFSLFPIKKLGRPGWEYRLATWPKEVDSAMHKMFDGLTDEPIAYERTANYNGLHQYCKIVKRPDNKFYVEPGDGYDFIIQKNSVHNKIEDKDEEIDDNEIPDMKCVVCFTNKKSRVLSCGHVCLCGSCAKIIYDDTKKCPICKAEMKSMPMKLFFC